MAMSGTDTLILVPLMPLAPVLVTWWLPWEKWIPWGDIPKFFLGPYALYAAFVAWHFKLDRWAVAVAALIGTVLSVWAVIEKIKKPETAPPSNDQPRQQANEG